MMNEYFKIFTEYKTLDRMKKSNLARGAFKQRATFEKVLTL